MDIGEKHRYQEWLREVAEIASRHGVSSKELVSILFRDHMVSGTRKTRLYEWVESDKFANYLMTSED